MATREEPAKENVNLKKVRGTLKGQITRTLNTLKSKTTNYQEVPGRLKLLEDIWCKYTSIQDQILNETTDEEELEKELDYGFEMEELYIEVSALLQTCSVPTTPNLTTLNDKSVAEAIPNITFVQYSENEKFVNFIKRLESYFLLKNVSLAKTKAHVLLNAITPELHQTLCYALSPENPTDKSYNELVDTLQQLIDPKPSILANQHKFICRTQLEGESVSTFARELKRLTVDCGLNCEHCDKPIVDTFLKIQFIRGLLDNEIRIRLLQESGDKRRQFSNIVNIAESIEQSKLESCAMKIPCDKMEHAYKVSAFHERNKNNRPRPTPNLEIPMSRAKTPVTFEDLKGRCYRCGSSKHRASVCRFRNEFCSKCNKIGHISNVCLSRRNMDNVTQKEMNFVGNAKLHDDESTYEINMMTSKSPHDKFIITVQIEGKDIDMELDTGAALTSISLNSYRKLNLPSQMYKTHVEMRTYTGEIIKPMGMCFVKCAYKNQDFHGKLYVLKQDVDPIFGREWLREIKMNWADVKQIHLNETTQLNKLLNEFNDVFKADIGKIPTEKGHLRLKDGTKPIFCKPRQVPYALRKPVEDELRRLEEAGIITKVEHSQWGTPIVPVRKPDGSVRLCADYKVTANKQVLDENYPIPRIDDIYAQMNKGKYFCTLDISKAYLHLPMDEESALIQTLSTHLGLYKVNRLMFGIKVAPSIWQRFMDKMLHGIAGTLCFFDDIIVQGSTYDETLSRLRCVLERVKQHDLRINKDKCQFFTSSVKYLGHVIDEFGLHKSKENTEAIVKTRRPKDIHELRTFLGLANYYNRFIPNLATTLHPLNSLLRQNEKFNWTQECEESFYKVKSEITSDTTLAHYDPDITLTLATDASPVGLGACLSHRYEDGTERPIAFASRTLTKTEQKYSQIDKEAVGIFWGLKKFFAYCYGRRFVLITDHKPLVSIFDPSKTLPAMTASRIFNYAHFLSGFDYKIEYRDTNAHGNADYLSRFPTSTEPNKCDDHERFMIHQIETIPVKRNEVKGETAKDPQLKVILQHLVDGKSLKHLGLEDCEYSLQDGCIFRGTRIVVPKSLQNFVLNELHEGHLGMTKMKLLARGVCYWKNIDKDIEKLVKQCPSCQMKSKAPHKEGVHPWEPTNEPWQRIHVDFAGPIGGWWYFIIVDSFTKWVEVIPTKSTTTDWCLKHLEGIFCTFGLPYVLVSDNGTQFTSGPFEDFLSKRGIIHKTIAPYHPASNGQAERVVQTVKTLLKASEGTGDIHKRLNIILKQLRRSQSSTTGMSPYQLMFGRHIRTTLDLLNENPYKVQVSDSNGKTRRWFNIGQHVFALNFSASSGGKWCAGKVVKRLGNVMYLLKMENGLTWKRHTDQIRKA